MPETPTPKKPFPVLPIAVAVAIGACLGLAAAALLESRQQRTQLEDLRGSVRLMRETPCAGCAEKARIAAVDTVTAGPPPTFGPGAAGTGEPVGDPVPVDG